MRRVTKTDAERELRLSLAVDGVPLPTSEKWDREVEEWMAVYGAQSVVVEVCPEYVERTLRNE